MTGKWALVVPREGAAVGMIAPTFKKKDYREQTLLYKKTIVTRVYTCVTNAYRCVNF
jgi:hypothetical protein